MGDLARLLKLLRPYRLLFIAGIVVTVLSSVLEGFTFVLLIPFLASGSPDTALRNVVLVVLGALVLKNATGYASAYWSAVIQEGVVRDLRMRLFQHLQTLPLGYFHRTKGGQT